MVCMRPISNTSSRFPNTVAEVVYLALGPTCGIQSVILSSCLFGKLKAKQTVKNKPIIMADVAVGVHPVHHHAAHGKAPKKAKAASKGEKKPKAHATHPPVNEMVVAALNNLKERHGTSLQAVKKYIGANYQCDLAKLSTFIRKCLKSGVASGTLVQTKGTGASGSFKLKVYPKLVSGEKKAKVRKAGAGGAAKKLAKKPLAGKPKKAGGVKKAKPAGVRAVKRAGGGAKKAGAKGLKQKSTKHSKSVAKKPRTPKPKKATGLKKAHGAKK